MGSSGEDQVPALEVGWAHSGQMQALPRSDSGMLSSASRDTGSFMHQQLSAGRPATIAH